MSTLFDSEIILIKMHKDTKNIHIGVVYNNEDWNRQMLGNTYAQIIENYIKLHYNSIFKEYLTIRMESLTRLSY